MKEVILRFLGGNASSEEIVLLQTWLEESEANRQYFDEVNSTYQASITLNRLNHHKVGSENEGVVSVSFVCRLSFRPH